MTVKLTSNFLKNSRGFTFADTGTVTWTLNASTNELSAIASTSGGPSAANPTAKVGLTAVNGSAATFLRSDGAPPIDQAISPTWTGNHAFEATSGVSLEVEGTSGNYSADIQGNSASGSSKGLRIRAGTTSADFAVVVANQGNTQDYLIIYGDGHGLLGPTATSGIKWDTSGNVTLSARFAINGGTPTAPLSGFGSPSGTVTSGLSSSATLAQTAGTLAALLAYLKTIGVVAS